MFCKRHARKEFEMLILEIMMIMGEREKNKGRKSSSKRNRDRGEKKDDNWLNHRDLSLGCNGNALALG